MIYEHDTRANDKEHTVNLSSFENDLTTRLCGTLGKETGGHVHEAEILTREIQLGWKTALCLSPGRHRSACLLCHCT